jgi:hypothetical protein
MIRAPHLGNNLLQDFCYDRIGPGIHKRRAATDRTSRPVGPRCRLRLDH